MDRPEQMMHSSAGGGGGDGGTEGRRPAPVDSEGDVTRGGGWSSGSSGVVSDTFEVGLSNNLLTCVSFHYSILKRRGLTCPRY